MSAALVLECPSLATSSLRLAPLAAARARMSEIMEMQVKARCPLTRLDPYPPEVGPSERRSLWADEDEPPLPRLGKTLQVPANLGHELGREGHSAAARV